MDAGGTAGVPAHHRHGFGAQDLLVVEHSVVQDHPAEPHIVVDGRGQSPAPPRLFGAKGQVHGHERTVRQSLVRPRETRPEPVVDEVRGVGHPERPEEGLFEHDIEGCADDDLDHQRDPLQATAVVPPLARVEREDRRNPGVHHFVLGFGGEPVEIVCESPVPDVVDDTGRMGQEVPERDHRPGSPQPSRAVCVEALEDGGVGEVGTYRGGRGVQVQPAGFDQLHRQRGHQGFGQGVDAEDGVHGHGLVVTQRPHPGSPFGNDAVGVETDRDGPGDVPARHGPPEQRVETGRHRTTAAAIADTALCSAVDELLERIGNGLRDLDVVVVVAAADADRTHGLAICLERDPAGHEHPLGVVRKCLPEDLVLLQPLVEEEFRRHPEPCGDRCLGQTASPAARVDADGRGDRHDLAGALGDDDRGVDAEFGGFLETGADDLGRGGVGNMTLGGQVL